MSRLKESEDQLLAYVLHNLCNPIYRNIQKESGYVPLNI